MAIQTKLKKEYMAISILAAMKEFNIGRETIVEYLKTKGFQIENKPTAKLDEAMHEALLAKFAADKKVKEEAADLKSEKQKAVSEKVAPSAPPTPAPQPLPPVVEEIKEEPVKAPVVEAKEEKPETQESEAKPVKKKAEKKAPDNALPGPKVIGKVDLAELAKPKAKKKEDIPPPPVEEVKAVQPTAVAPEPQEEEKRPEALKPEFKVLPGLKIQGKIELKPEVEKTRKPLLSTDNTDPATGKKKRKRKIVGAERVNVSNENRTNQRRDDRTATGKTEITDKQIQDKLKATLARITPGSRGPGIGQVRSKIRRNKRDAGAAIREEAALERELQSKVLKATEFLSANELAKMMNQPVTAIITTCMNLGMMVSINQRLDAETITVVADEFGYSVEFVSADVQEEITEEDDDPALMTDRPPIVTVMGHVDHGKTSLLDFVRKTNVIAGEAGGITQHIGAYEVTLANGKKIAFLDTPGHEAFTAMRARGAKLTDIAIIVIAADDQVMPQTKEAISHAQAANVPIVFALNKMDKEGANPERIKEQLANMNILVEDWGGKYQCQEISAKKGLNVDQLLDKVLLEAELLELKANPHRKAMGTVVEASLDKGRGIVANLLVQTGTLRVGDPILAGPYSGKVKALFNERGGKLKEAGPSTPVTILGFTGVPTAGDRFQATATEQEAKEIANKRQQLIREQGLRTHKHITLDEIGRRLAIGNFKELNLVVKGDVDGSVEALSDSLLKLSTQEIQVNVIFKAVGQISESDVLLASASDAIIVGFNVRPSAQARKLAEAEDIDIRIYSIIYNAIEEIKSAMEGMLAPAVEEKITGNAEVRDVFKVTKVGTIAGCMVTEGKILRNNKVRLIRDGVVVYTGDFASLKRFKDDVKEVASGYECGIGIANFNDIKVGDVIEAFEMIETKRRLDD